MANRKRQISEDSTAISGTSKKQIKKSHYEISDSNALILHAKVKTSAPAPQKLVKILSKTERKKLEKIKKTKDEKSTLNDILEELKSFNKLRPEIAIKALCDEVKNNKTIVDRKTLSTKVKPVSKRNFKRWEKKRSQPIDDGREKSPDTSDFSTDDDTVDEACNDVLRPNLAEPEKPTVTPVSVVIVPELPTVNNTPKTIISAIPKSYIIVDRPIDVQNARMDLPILGEEATIMEAVSENDIVIVSGATGCGKTTQVPQFLYEAGFTKNGYKIGITEPRRIAAISVSERVKYELACTNSNMVAYHVRYQNTSTCSTQIKFMTDGILLQELKNDILLQSYSAIIIDEAHERSVYTDVLIGLLSIVVRARRRSYEKAQTSVTDKSNTNEKPPMPLKLIIMSATLRVADFAENKRLFPGENRPPVIKLDGRQFPVQVTYSKHTRHNYLEEAFKMTYKIHNENVEGGILVFVTGQQDCLTLCKWLKKAFPVTQKFINQAGTESKTVTNRRKNVENQEETELIKVNLSDFNIIPIDEESELNVNEENEDNDEEEEEGNESDDESPVNFSEIMSGLYTNNTCMNPLYVLPLYSLLEKDRQELVFQPPPPGQRLVVIATNVAETSLTIPNIKYVIDTGLEKVKKWDKITGVSKFQLERISKSSAEQRKGRAGRTGPGQCFRLYSSAVFEEMIQFSLPEIVQRPVDDVVLLLRNYIHSSIAISEFCLPTVPSESAITKAENQLIAIGALRRIKLGTKSLSEITDLGRSMSQIPLSPRFARMLLLCNQKNLLPYAVLMASLLSVPDFFSNNTSSLESGDTSEANALAANFKRESIKKRSDLMLGDITVLVASFCKLENVCLRSEDEAKRAAELCGVRWKAFCEVKKLRQQLTDILTANIKNLDLSVSLLARPTNDQFEHLRQLILAGSSCNVAMLAPANITAGASQAQRRKEKGMYLSCTIDKPVFIHSQSVLCRERMQWVVYQDVFENIIHGDSTAKAFMRNVSVIEPQWLPLYCTLTCRVEGLLLDNKQTQELKPIYDGNHDRVMAFAKKIFYGERNLALPNGIRVPVSLEILENVETQADFWRRWFARFFLDGAVFKSMEPWRSKMKSTCKPELLLAPFANLRPEIMCVMAEINKLELPSKKAIADKWKTDTNYLLNAYLEWVRADERESVIAAWPPIDNTV